MLAGWLALALVLVALAHTGRGAPGLYYDEAWFAAEARRFVEPSHGAALPPGVQSVEIAGRPFPLFTSPYLGALKSQWLIPWLALFGTRVETLRFATLGLALVALLATLFATRRVFGTPTALLAGALLAFDPSVFFHAQFEWGPFTSGWACRALGVALLLRSAQGGGGAGRASGGGAGRASGAGGASAGAGGLLLGLSVYSRIDSLLVIGALALAVGVVHGRALLALVRARRAAAAAALLGFVLGALPMALNLPRVLRSFGMLTARGDFADRLATLLTTLDGSYVHRLMEQGGRFDQLADASAPFAPLGVAWGAALLAAAASARRKGGALHDGRAALALACLALGAALLALRGATRAHHMLNLAPLVHVLVAASLVALARVGSLARGVAVAATLAILAADARSIAETRELLARTGGRGWWSDALGELARELEAEPGAVAVSLDWGFHLPLSIETTQATLREPIWDIASAASRLGEWSLTGTRAQRYLVHDAPWDRFGFGPSFLAAVRLLGERAELRPWRDREGALVFYTVRFDADHRVRFRHGLGFRIDLARAGQTGGAAPSSHSAASPRSAAACTRGASAGGGEPPSSTAPAQPAARPASTSRSASPIT